MSEAEIFRASCEAELTAGQRSRFALLMQAIHATIDRYALRQAPYNHASDAAMIERPHNVFCIDGGRGSGKTFVLLTLEHLLRRLNEPTRDNLHNEWTVLDWDRWMQLINRDTSRSLVLPLRIIFPSDLTDQEYVMEVMFASIERDIKAHTINNCGNSALKKSGDALLKMLSNDIARGQYHARRFGVDAVVRDSMNYDDLVTKYGHLNETAAFRTEKWRLFIEKYLDWRGVHALALLLDDSDLRPEVTNDLLHTARTMFNHPRLITVIAGNTHSIRSSLLNIRLRELAKVMPALNLENHPSGIEWRRGERQNVEQILEKVLPESKRYYLPAAKLADFRVLIRGYTGNSSDVFQELVRSTIRSLRGEFMRTKMLLGFLHETGSSDLPSEKQLLALENYLSWWVFQSKYITQLGPRSARAAITFADYYGQLFIENTKNEQLENYPLKSPRKRLSVAMFENASNYALIQQFDDNEGHVTEWLGRQKLNSDWGEHRAFLINGRRIPAGSYSYKYLCFRLDIGLSLPLRENPEALVPRMLLPVVRGRKRIRHFYQPQGTPVRPKLLGISRWIDHAAIPGNCLFFYHLSALPDVTFLPGDDHKRDEAVMSGQGGTWEGGLRDKWEEQIERTDDMGTQRLLQYVIRMFPDVRKDIPTSILNEGLEKAKSLEYRALADLLGAPLASSQAVLAAPPKRKTTEDKAVKESTDSVVNYAQIALRSALFNDLRCAWHALLIWEASRKPDLGEQGNTPATGWLLSGIASAERMKLYTLEELQRTLRRDEWLSDVLIVFGRLVATNKDGNDPDFKRQNGAVQAKINGSKSSAKNAPFLPWQADDPIFVREYEGDNGWECYWRLLSRQMCNYWRIPSATNDKIVDALFEGFEERRVKIFNQDRGALNDAEHDRARLIEQARSVRAFIWLMYGLSPSLPAMIHADIAGSVAPDDGTDSLRERLREWNTLILQLTAITRYLKYKCLTMYLVSTLTHVSRTAGTELRLVEDGRSNEDRESPWPHILKPALSKLRDWLIINAAKFQDAPGETEREILTKLQNQCNDWIRAVGPEKNDEVGQAQREIDPALLDLNIMPDASPSTLFGDGWLQRILSRIDIDVAKGDEAIERSTFGLFGETDRWLWAAHKMIGEAWNSATPTGGVATASDVGRSSVISGQ